MENIRLSGGLLASGITYEPFGPVKSFWYGNGHLYQNTTDNAYRPAMQKAGTVLERTYNQYDGNGNLMQLTEAKGGTQTTSLYSYEWDDSLDTASGPFGNRDYNYWWPLGLRTSTNEGSEPLTYSYHLNRLVSVGDPTYYVGAEGIEWQVGTSVYSAYGYDLAGNQTSKLKNSHDCQLVNDTDPRSGAPREYYTCTVIFEEDWDFSYTAYNQLTTATRAGAGQTDYRYNALGQRISKTLPDGTRIQYTYGLDGALLAELDSFNTPKKEYVYFNGGLLAVRDMSGGIGTVYYAHNDHLGTPQLLTDTTGQVVWSAEYDPFGAAEVNEDPDGDGNRVTLNIRFPGQYLDTETRLHYNYFRYYDPETGKYITSDPIGIGGGLNTYAYVRSNPVNYVDPNGLGPVTFGVCTAFNAGYTIGSFYKTMDDLHSTELLQDQLILVNKKISECPVDDVERLDELSKIRNELVKALSESVGRTAAENNSIGLGDWGKAAVVEGTCTLLLRAPIP